MESLSLVIIDSHLRYPIITTKVPIRIGTQHNMANIAKDFRINPFGICLFDRSLRPTQWLYAGSKNKSG